MNDRNVDVEVLAPDHVLGVLSSHLREISLEDVGTFQHRGRDGEVGLLGNIAKVPESAIRGLFDLILSIADRNRVRVTVGDLQVDVRDVQNLEEVMKLLAAHGLVGGDANED